MLAIIIIVFFLVVVFLLIFHAGNKRSVSYRRNVGNLRRDAGLNDSAPPHRSLSSRNYRYPPDTGQNDTFEDNWRFGGGRFGGAGAGDSYDHGNRPEFDRRDSNGWYNGSFGSSNPADSPGDSSGNSSTYFSSGYFSNVDSSANDLSCGGDSTGSGPSGSDSSNGDSSSGSSSGSDSSSGDSSGGNSPSGDSWNSGPA